MQAPVSRGRARKPIGGRELRGLGRALAAVRDEEEQYDRFRRDLTAERTSSDHEMIVALASDIPTLLRAPTIAASDMRVFMRFRVEKAGVTVQVETGWSDVVIHWAGCFVSRHEDRRLEQLREVSALMDRVLEPHRAGKTSNEIANRKDSHLARETTGSLSLGRG